MFTWKDTKWNTITQYRSIWMGIAMLWIVLYHSNIKFPCTFIENIRSIGYGGVDIFFFASGLGVYFSYMKDHNALEFMKRRLYRLAPIYIPFIIVWILYQSFIKGNFVKEAIGNFFAIQGFTNLGNEFNWYITALFIFYILTPFLSEIIEKINKPHQFFIFIGILLIMTVSFWGSYNGIIIVTRLPIFIIGMYVAKLSKEQKLLTTKWIVILTIAIIIGMILLSVFLTQYQNFLWLNGLYWYPFILITPGVCLWISIFSEIAQKYKMTNGLLYILKKIGEYSFEIYLVHIFVFHIYNNNLLPNGILTKSNGTMIFAMILIIPLSMLLHMVSEKLRNKLLTYS